MYNFAHLYINLSYIGLVYQFELCTDTFLAAPPENIFQLSLRANIVLHHNASIPCCHLVIGHYSHSMYLSPFFVLKLRIKLNCADCRITNKGVTLFLFCNAHLEISVLFKYVRGSYCYRSLRGI